MGPPIPIKMKRKALTTMHITYSAIHTFICLAVCDKVL